MNNLLLPISFFVSQRDTVTMYSLEKSLGYWVWSSDNKVCSDKSPLDLSFSMIFLSNNHFYGRYGSHLEKTKFSALSIRDHFVARNSLKKTHGQAWVRSTRSIILTCICGRTGGDSPPNIYQKNSGFILQQSSSFLTWTDSIHLWNIQVFPPF